MVSSGTGNMHGMPVSFNLATLATDSTDLLPDSSYAWLTSRLHPSRLVYIGLRDVDPPEWELIDRLSIAAYTMADVDRLGVEETVRQALARVDPENKRNIHMSFDIDSLDPAWCPSTGTPVKEGLTLREGLSLVEKVRDWG